ncbi:MAG: [Fe-Fe] hydrogenase large subunit C-terminal domain-containing protein [Spirochaetaceae bacterium]
MNARRPIYTEPAECQDCYRCVRGCPVKAIRVRDGHASVEPETCIYCGNCVGVCPAKAKKVRQDLPRARQLLSLRESVYVSLAPSFVSEFSEYTPGQLTSALEALGFAGVSETALGAELVSREVNGWFAEGGSGVRISTACPVVVDLITKYHPELQRALGETPSPLIAHADYLRRLYGEDIGVVFIGPCIAKKCESDAAENLLEVAITFEDLRRWFEQSGISPARFSEKREARFLPWGSGVCRAYPVDGGMISSLSLSGEERFGRCVHLSGMGIVREALQDLEIDGPGEKIFLELLACEGGCVNGPGTTRRGSLLARRSGVLTFAREGVSEKAAGDNGAAGSDYPKANGATSLPKRWRPAPVTLPEAAEGEIREALRKVGKRSREDELNCGGCGYDTCRTFARALVAGRAEPAMCVAYMRRLAQKKNSALLKTMPSAAVTVDAGMRIVESNRNFARLCGPDAEAAYDALPGLEGAQLERFLPLEDLFRAVLHSGADILDKTVRVKGAIINASVFSIEDHHLVGAILQDVTAPAMRKQQIVEKSKEVIDKNLKTVQQIAYLLGENASETELILNSIVRSFSPEESAGE